MAKGIDDALDDLQEIEGIDAFGIRLTIISF